MTKTALEGSLDAQEPAQESAYTDAAGTSAIPAEAMPDFEFGTLVTATGGDADQLSSAVDELLAFLEDPGLTARLTQVQRERLSAANNAILRAQVAYERSRR